MDTSSWYTLPYLDAKIPMPPKDLYAAIITVCLFIPVVVVCQWLAPFNRQAAHKLSGKSE